MLFRAFIVSKIDEFHYKVRVPLINKSEGALGSTPSDELYTAVICSPAGSFPELRVNDAVFIAFENSDYSDPVILGMLFNEKSKSTKSSSDYATLSVASTATLPERTTIGRVSPHNIAALQNVNFDINDEITEIGILIDANKRAIANLRKRLDDVGDELVMTTSRYDKMINEVKNDYTEKDNELESSIDELSHDFDTHDSNTDIHVTSQNKSLWNSKAAGNHTHSSLSNVSLQGSVKFGSTSFGTGEPPSGASTGQVFFKLEG